jgi:hypothetical protein
MGYLVKGPAGLEAVAERRMKKGLVVTQRIIWMFRLGPGPFTRSRGNNPGGSAAPERVYRRCCRGASGSRRRACHGRATERRVPTEELSFAHA